MRVRPAELAAVAAAVVALAAARVWLRFAPGHAVRWGSQVGDLERGSRGWLTGRGSRGSLTGRGSRGSLTGRGSRWAADARIRSLCKAVIAVGTRPPLAGTCLEQAVALVLLLTIAGIRARLVVGVSRLESNVRAHAWVECGGDVVLGGAQAAGFEPLVGASSSAPSPAVSSCPG